MNNITQFLQKIDISKYFELATTGIMNYIPKILGSIIILWIGFKIINQIREFVLQIMEKQNLDPMLKSFLTSLMTGILKILIILTSAGILGVQTSSFVALLASAGLAIGMALSGTLQNFASGVMIIFFKPFKAGHWVEIWGFAGSVTKIEIFNTIMLTWDKKTIIIPNSEVTKSSMINYSNEPIRRIDLEVWISYTDSIKLAKETLEDIAKNEKYVLLKKPITIGVKALGDNSVIIVFRVFVKSENYWEVFYRLNETIKNQFDANGLNFPFPQQDVHLYNEK